MKVIKVYQNFLFVDLDKNQMVCTLDGYIYLHKAHQCVNDDLPYSFDTDRQFTKGIEK